jgi:hypothetical protein
MSSRREANHRTHPSGTYGKDMERKAPWVYSRACSLINEFCGRMVEWGCARYSPRSREWQVLDGLRALNRDLGTGNRTGNPDWTAVVKIAQAIQEVDGTVDQMGISAFSLEFEFEGARYNISEIVEFIRRHAESRLAEREAAHTHRPAEANMKTLLGRLSKYIG